MKKTGTTNFGWGQITPYLRYIIESFHSYANSRNLSLRFQTTVESLVMDYDPEQMKQVLSNLISNAINFTPSGGDVLIRVSEAENRLKVEVRDTGIGIGEKTCCMCSTVFIRSMAHTPGRTTGFYS